ncbi:hypothetical protein FUMI01_21320 [Flavobacterium sp. UMI-01]|nr:hypothetical protein FUMI01_21320 [Flavobacterium sp. UMI-01]
MLAVIELKMTSGSLLSSEEQEMKSVKRRQSRNNTFNFFINRFFWWLVEGKHIALGNGLQYPLLVILLAINSVMRFT